MQERTPSSVKLLYSPYGWKRASDKILSLSDDENSTLSSNSTYEQELSLADEKFSKVSTFDVGASVARRLIYFHSDSESDIELETDLVESLFDILGPSCENVEGVNLSEDVLKQLDEIQKSCAIPSTNKVHQNVVKLPSFATAFNTAFSDSNAFQLFVHMQENVENEADFECISTDIEKVQKSLTNMTQYGLLYEDETMINSTDLTAGNRSEIPSKVEICNEKSTTIKVPELCEKNRVDFAQNSQNPDKITDFQINELHSKVEKCNSNKEDRVAASSKKIIEISNEKNSRVKTQFDSKLALKNIAKPKAVTEASTRNLCTKIFTSEKSSPTLNENINVLKADFQKMSAKKYSKSILKRPINDTQVEEVSNKELTKQRRTSARKSKVIQQSDNLVSIVKKPKNNQLHLSKNNCHLVGPPTRGVNNKHHLTNTQQEILLQKMIIIIQQPDNSTNISQKNKVLVTKKLNVNIPEIVEQSRKVINTQAKIPDIEMCSFNRNLQFQKVCLPTTDLLSKSNLTEKSSILKSVGTNLSRTCSKKMTGKSHSETDLKVGKFRLEMHSNGQVDGTHSELNSKESVQETQSLNLFNNPKLSEIDLSTKRSENFKRRVETNLSRTFSKKPAVECQSETNSKVEIDTPKLSHTNLSIIRSSNFKRVETNLSATCSNKTAEEHSETNLKVGKFLLEVETHSSGGVDEAHSGLNVKERAEETSEPGGVILEQTYDGEKFISKNKDSHQTLECSRRKEVVFQLGKTDSVKENKREYACSFCTQTYKSIKSLKTHMNKIHLITLKSLSSEEIKHLTTRAEFVEKKTPFLGSKQLDANSQQVKNHNQGEVSSDEPKEKDPIEEKLIYTCNLCGAIYFSHRGIQNHVSKRHSGQPGNILIYQASSKSEGI